MVKIDLHTHSQASPDGSLNLDHYRRMLGSGRLDYIAITDHNVIDFAQKAQAALGDQIIVGEEVMTLQGEIIGLYLHEVIPAGLSASETVTYIHAQGGLVYIPHPFETVRHGISVTDLASLVAQVDIVETYNGRSLQHRDRLAQKWASEHGIASAASSDAHGWHGWGKTYSEIAAVPAVRSLVAQLQNGQLHTHSTGVLGRMYPTLNRMRKRG